MKFALLVFFFLLPFGRSVVYRPDYTPRMKNTSARWNIKAKLSGPNVCAKEIIWGATPITYDIAWTGGATCTATTVKLDCCEGWLRVPGERGCTRVATVPSAVSAATNLQAGKSLKLFNSAGLESYLTGREDTVTILAPLDHYWSGLSSQSHHYLEDGATRASRLIDAPPLLLSHVITGRQIERNLRNDGLLTPLTGQPLIRINKYPNGVMTANCVPIVNRDIITQGPLIHTLAGILPQGYLFHITDTVLRDVNAHRFANFLAQSRLESHLRLEVPHTLFLPTDTAVEALSHHQIHALLYDGDGLRALVLNHIAEGVHCGVMLSSAMLVSKHGKALRTECRRSGTFIDGAAIVSTDKMATNGVIHGIDRVLVPKRAMLLLDLLKSLGLSSLASLVEHAGLTSVFLSPDSFTLFAPTNEALAGANRLSDKDVRNLLLNHMTTGRVFVSSLKTSEILPSKGTRSPYTIKITHEKILVDAAVVIQADEEGLNGVIHIVDRILVPPLQTSVLQYLQDSGRYTQFLNALRTTGSSLYNSVASQGAREKKTVFAVSDSDIAYSLYYRAEIVRHHVIGRALMSEEVPANGSYAVPTLGGSELVLARRSSTLYAGSAPVLSKDIVCSDGVIHTLREVIIDPQRYWNYNYN